MHVLAAAALVGLALPLLLVSAYFTTLLVPSLARLRAGLGRLFGSCGIETSSCATVSRTAQARLLGGVPNAVLGLLWALALLALAVTWLATGGVRVPTAFLAAALAGLLASAWLAYHLVFVLRRPCPL
jgi:uncharacterized membrane protein